MIRVNPSLKAIFVYRNYGSEKEHDPQNASEKDREFEVFQSKMNSIVGLRKNVNPEYSSDNYYGA
jgi:hypothetical protein